MAPSTKTTEIDGPLLLNRDRHKDARGWFEVLDDPAMNLEIEEDGIDWQQWNVSHSTRGVLRGLHYQSTPHQQAKLIRVVEGEIWDVVVDLREKSPTYRKWQAFELSADRPQSLYIPKGFAHGFLTVSDTTTLIYAVSCPRCIESEEIIPWNDPSLRISWPLPRPVLSMRDGEKSY